MTLRKYPRTHHIEGSRLQPGDHDLSAIPFAELAGRHLVVEEKVDGANSGLSFVDGALRLQCRGHYLTGGPRERQFDLFKAWAYGIADPLREVLGERYVLYGEWLYAKHTIFYDQLPHYFLEYDVLDLERDVFLSTPARRALLDGLPLHPVPVLAEQSFQRLDDLTDWVGGSAYRSDDVWSNLLRLAGERDQDPERVARETDTDPHMEGLYVKWEEDGQILGRYKWVRASFLTAVTDSGSHWQDRPIFPNVLAPGVDLFGG